MFFFFSSRRRHTRFKCDWSSDVCSSDLACTRGDCSGQACGNGQCRGRRAGGAPIGRGSPPGRRGQIGRASGRGKGENSGGAASLKKKKKKVQWDPSRYKQMKRKKNYDCQ